MDMSFYRMIRTNQLAGVPDAPRAFQEFKGIKCFLEIDNHSYPAPIYYVRGYVENKGLPISLKQGFTTGANSGFGALMLAVCLKASPIYLLGYDMSHSNGRSHYHKRYRRRQPPQQLQRFISAFKGAAPAIAARGIQVINLNPQSALKCFLFSTLEEVLSGPNINDVKPQADVPGDPAGPDIARGEGDIARPPA